MRLAILNNFRDCVKEAFEQGAQRGLVFRTMRHAIILEFISLGLSPSEIKDCLIEWNKRCERVLGPADVKRQLFDYVDWVFKHDCHIGCTALEDYCLGKENCNFHSRKLHLNREVILEDPFDFQKAKAFLEERYRGFGLFMFYVLKALRWIQLERVTGEIILVGCRTLTSMIRESNGKQLDPKTIWRYLQDLVNEGMLEIIIKGKRGTFSRESNGYRFLKWKPP